MVKTNQHIIGEQLLKNDNGVLTVRDEDKNITGKNYHEKLLDRVGMG